MINNSQFVSISTSTMAENAPSTGNRIIPADGFLQFLDRSLGARQSLEVHRVPLKNDRNHMMQTKGVTAGVRVDKPLSRVISNNGSGTGAGIKLESVQISTDGTSKTMEPSGKPLRPVEAVKQCEKLQNKMDEVIAVLHSISILLTNMDSIEADTGKALSDKEALIALKLVLENQISEFVETAKYLQGTQTSGHAFDFAEKLAELLGDDFAAIMSSTDAQIQNPRKLENLVHKMLAETETVRMHVVRESIQEFVIPAMDTVMNNISEDDIDLSDAVITKASVEPSEDMKANTTDSQSQQADTEHRFDNSMNVQEVTLNVANETTVGIGSYPVHTMFTENLQETFQSGSPAPSSSSESIFSREAVVQQVIEKAETLLSENKSELLIQLKPDHLGKISLRVIQERGEIMAKFMAESEQVKAILESNMQLLRDSLQKNGIEVQSLSVSVGQHGQEHQSGHPGRQNGNSRPQKEEIPMFTRKENIHQTYQIRGEQKNPLASDSEIDLTA